MRLEELLLGVQVESLHAPACADEAATARRRPAAPEVAGLCYDSRAAGGGDLFVALPGERTDGHRFAEAALEKGAAGAVVGEAGLYQGLCQRWPGRALVRARDTRRALARMAANFSGRPSERLTLVGVTGTNGKTTTSYLIESVLRAAALAPGVIGTIDYRLGAKRWPAPHTTPQAPELQQMLSRMCLGGAASCVLEVSSHALLQRRTHALEFNVVVFTNLSQDHLDYHRDMEDYFAAKRLLFTEQLAEQICKKDPVCVINADDPFGARLIGECQEAGRRVISYGLAPTARPAGGPARTPDLFPLELAWDRDGLAATVRTPSGELPVRSPLVGEYNVYNVLAALSVACALGLSGERAARGIAALERVPGRMEPVPNELGIDVLVDYAHTPDALRNVLVAARRLTHGRLLCVFGCGGDRDRGKRAPMARAAQELADLPILTSDNPRTEDPEHILADARVGLSGTEGEDFLVEPDRRGAICLAIVRARRGDLVLIAGKGHEDYQIVGTEKRHFDDREEAAAALRARQEGVASL